MLPARLQHAHEQFEPIERKRIARIRTQQMLGRGPRRLRGGVVAKYLLDAAIQPAGPGHQDAKVIAGLVRPGRGQVRVHLREKGCGVRRTQGAKRL